jgi:GTP-binding protein
MFRAGHGEAGKGARKHGRNGGDLEFRVPVGTEIWSIGHNRKKIVDLVSSGQVAMVARGGGGGRGNARFATPINQFPLLAEAGEPAEELVLDLELKLLADVGVIGAPNAGKSSLLAALTAARPKIAQYPFTTIEPVLGVIDSHGEGIVVVDIPGLIEGAHEGVGLGHDFLRHMERTRLVVHVIDGSTDDPAGDYRKIRKEMGLFSRLLVGKPEIIALNKMDVEGVPVRAEEVRRELEGEASAFCCISAAGRTGLRELQDEITHALDKASRVQEVPGGRPPDVPVPVLRPREMDAPGPTKIRKVGDVFEVIAPSATRLAAMVDERNWEARIQLYDRLRRMGVTEALDQAGIKPGDTFRVGKLEWEWE